MAVKKFTVENNGSLVEKSEDSVEKDIKIFEDEKGVLESIQIIKRVNGVILLQATKEGIEILKDLEKKNKIKYK